MATDDKADKGSVTEQLHEIANKLEKLDPARLDRSAVVCCLISPCDHEEEEGHKHSQVTIVIGGNGALCAEAHRDLTNALVKVAPGPMFGGLVARLDAMFKQRATDQMN